MPNTHGRRPPPPPSHSGNRRPSNPQSAKPRSRNRRTPPPPPTRDGRPTIDGCSMWAPAVVALALFDWFDRRLP